MKKERNNKITSNFLIRSFIKKVWTAQMHDMYYVVYVLKNNETVTHFFINFILLNIFLISKTHMHLNVRHHYRF